MVKRTGGNAHDRALAKSAQKKSAAPASFLSSSDVNPSAKQPGSRIRQATARLFSNIWVNGIILLILGLIATEMVARWKSSKIPTVEISPLQITFGVSTPGATNTFSDQDIFRITNRTEQDIYGVVVKLRVDTTKVSIENFEFGVPQSSLKPLDPYSPNGQVIGDLLDTACLDASNHIVFLVYMPHLDPKDSRVVSLAYKNPGYDRPDTAPTAGETITLPDPKLGFTVRAELSDFSKKPIPTHRTRSGTMYLLPVFKESLKCAALTPISLSK